MKNFIHLPHLDNARDLMHPGIKSNEALSSSIIDFIR
jgi:hypothetical protein